MRRGIRKCQPTPREKLRDDFIKNFKRTGLNTTTGDATMLRILVECSGAKNGVEVGTATGYGALRHGTGLRAQRRTPATIDIDPKMVKIARDNIDKMKLGKTVTVVEGDALKVMPALEGQYDFVFIDAVKRDYLKYLKAIEPKLKPGEVIVADNVIKSAKEMPDFLEAVQNSPNYHTVIIRASEEKGDGMAVIYKVK